MKKLLSLCTFFAFVSLAIFISCKDDGDDTSTPTTNVKEQRAEELQASWTANDAGVTIGGQAPDGDWSGFELTISNASQDGGDYAATGVPSDASAVWPASGTWTFNNDGATEILRDDDVVMTISSVTETALTLRFAIEDPNARTSGIYGNWQFTCSKN